MGMFNSSIEHRVRLPLRSPQGFMFRPVIKMITVYMSTSGQTLFDLEIAPLALPRGQLRRPGSVLRDPRGSEDFPEDAVQAAFAAHEFCGRRGGMRLSRARRTALQCPFSCMASSKPANTVPTIVWTPSVQVPGQS